MPGVKRDALRVDRARGLRREAPSEEQLLWRFLKAKRLGGLKFRRQEYLGPFFVDFYCHEFKLAIEVDGLSHDSAQAQGRDRWREEQLAALGVRVLRFQGDEVRRHLEGVLEAIYREATGTEWEWPSPAAESSSQPGGRP